MEIIERGLNYQQAKQVIIQKRIMDATMQADELNVGKYKVIAKNNPRKEVIQMAKTGTKTAKNTNKNYISALAVEKEYSLTPGTPREYIKAKKLKATRQGNRWLIEKADAEKVFKNFNKEQKTATKKATKKATKEIEKIEEL